MHFNIGGHRYELVVEKDPKVDAAGNVYDGEAIAKTRQIMLYAPQADKLDVFLHEWWHTWQFHTPRPRTDEEACDLVATAVAALLKDLARQGGVLALLTLGNVDEMPGRDAAAFALPASCGSRTCGVCSTSVAPGSVICEPDGIDAATSVPAVKIGFYCEFCNHIQQTREMATVKGKPTGVLIGEPEFLRGEEAVKWIAKHESAGGSRELSGWC